MKLLTTTILAVLLAGNMNGAFGQGEPKSDTEGLFLNLHLNGSSWRLSDDTDLGEIPDASGGGMGLAFGYGASQTVTLFMAFDGARVSSEGENEDETYTLVHFDIGTMITLLGQSSRFRPYGKASFTARTAEFDLDELGLTTFGAAFSAGAGVMVFLGNRFALSAEGIGTWGSQTEITSSGLKIDTDISSNSGRINLGVNWFPGG